MTLIELKALSDQFPNTPEGNKAFLEDERVRGVFWKCLGQDERWKHLLGGWNAEAMVATCGKCGANLRLPKPEQIERYLCPVPDSIPGSLADAVELMRQCVAEKWERMTDGQRDCAEVEIDVVAAKLNGYHCTWIVGYVLDDLRFHFLIFAAAAGAVEVTK